MSLTVPPNDGDLTRLKDWTSRWTENRIGFHKEVVNPHLLKHLPVLASEAGGKETVFVPLCGKTKDLKYLEERGFNVVGLEYSEKACRDFFTENGIEFTSEPIPSTTPSTPDWTPQIHKSTSGTLSIIQDDLFAAQIPKSDLIYDRASNIAVLPAVRPQYADTMLRCLKPGGKILAITLERQVAPDVGPPFTLLEKDFREIYESRGCQVQLLESFNVPDSTSVERVFLVPKPGSGQL